MRPLIVIVLFALFFMSSTFASSSCTIKGNISFNTQEKIYHLPWCDSYNSTKIDTSYGEKWFCTEQEAVAAGRRKANNCWLSLPITTTPKQTTQVTNDGIYYVSSRKPVLDFWYAYGLTIYNNVPQFRPTDELLREESTKFFTQAFNKLFSSAPLSKTTSCVFSDITTGDKSLVTFVVQSCELGIFKWSDGKFYPRRKLTNAEAVAVVIRLIDGVLDESQKPWHTSYYAKLKSYATQYPSVSGVYNRMLDGNKTATRWDVLELIYVLYKALFYEENTSFDTEVVQSKSFCADQETIFACTIDPDGSMGLCPAKCLSQSSNQTPTQTTPPSTDNQIAYGQLNVSLSSSNPSSVSSQWKAKLALVQLSSVDGDTFLQSVEIMSLGSNPIPESARVWFERNGVRITARTSFTSDGKAILSFAPALSVKSNSTEMLDLYVELQPSAGSSFQFKSIAINASASWINGGFTTPSLVLTSPYTVAVVNFTNASNGSTLTHSNSSVEIWRFSITTNKDVALKSITLKQQGDASLSNLSNVVLERNGEVISNSYTINGTNLNLAIYDEIMDSTTATYSIKAVINSLDQSANIYELELVNDTDINITEKSTGFRATVTGAQKLGTHTIQ